jgi:hypothetical protein
MLHSLAETLADERGSPTKPAGGCVFGRGQNGEFLVATRDRHTQIVGPCHRDCNGSTIDGTWPPLPQDLEAS